MANIRVDLNDTIKDGSEIVFRSPVDCSAITGLVVYYAAENGAAASKEFVLADAHGHNVGDIDHLFAENVVVKVILDVTAGMAYVQNADTNAYIERTFVKTVNGVSPDENGNVEIAVPQINVERFEIGNDSGVNISVGTPNGDGGMSWEFATVYDGKSGSCDDYKLPAATADSLGGIKADKATGGDTQPVRIGADGKLYTAPCGTSGTATMHPLTFTGAVNATYDGSEAVEVEIPQGGGEDIIADEVVLASGTITANGSATEDIDTGVTAGDLKKYKMFFVGATAASNINLPNLYFRFWDGTSWTNSKTILRVNGYRGEWTVNAFLDDAKTMFMSVAGQAGNITLDPCFVKKVSDGTWISNNYGIYGSAATAGGIFVLDGVPDDTHIFIMPSAVYSVDVSWRITGVLR